MKSTSIAQRIIARFGCSMLVVFALSTATGCFSCSSRTTTTEPGTVGSAPAGSSSTTTTTTTP